MDWVAFKGMDSIFGHKQEAGVSEAQRAMRALSS
jgi:hypothetical protein